MAAARITLAVIAASVVTAAAPSAKAQCVSNASSCVTCHEAQGMRPVLQSTAPWHVDHGFGDLCASCHAGDAAAAEKDAAHVGLRNPLDDPTAACAGCHEDGNARAEAYLAAAATMPPAPPPAGPPDVPTQATSTATVDLVLAGISAVLAAALWFVGRRRRGVAGRPLGAVLRDKTWSPYAAGALLGGVVAFSEVVCGRPLAASGAFDKLAAYPGHLFFGSSQYYRYVMSPGITWQVWLVVGILLGSFVSARLSGEARLRWLPDTQWQERFGPSRAVRLGIAFAGAVIVQIGAGIAGGCTSGLAISGGAVLAPAAFLFMAGMFLGGIPTAWLWYRGRG